MTPISQFSPVASNVTRPEVICCCGSCRCRFGDGGCSWRRFQSASTWLSINISGTECYDVSSMGSGKGLAGVTCKTLSVRLAQRRRSQEDIIVHECTPRFQVAVLRKYLDMYDWMEFPLPGETISPHQLGCLL